MRAGAAGDEEPMIRTRQLGRDLPAHGVGRRGARVRQEHRARRVERRLEVDEAIDDVQLVAGGVITSRGLP